MIMKNSNYEGLFIFSNEDALQKAIAENSDIKEEHEKMQRVSDLLDEVKFYYHAKKKKSPQKLRAVCAVALLLFSTLTFGFVANDSDLLDTLRYGSTLSAEDLGFPVDSYGFLMVDE
jgi:hypothetical protein